MNNGRKVIDISQVTVKHVAAEAGVSTATVSRVLTGNGFVSEEVKVRVQSAMDKLNYQPNALARSLKNNKTNTIGVIIPDISNSFFMRAIRGIEEAVRHREYHLMISSSDDDPHKEQVLLQLLFEKRVDAVVLAGTGKNQETIARMIRAGQSIILLDRVVRIPGFELVSIKENNEKGAYILTRKLLDLGHRRIGVINGYANTSTGKERNEGFVKAVTESGLSQDRQLIYSGDFSLESGVSAIQHFFRLKDRPTAILSLNNNMSFGALLEMNRLGIRIPEDIMLASYGEVEAAQLLKNSSLLYIQQSPFEMGSRTGEILLAGIEGRQTETKQESLVFEPIVKQIGQQNKEDVPG